MSDFLTEPSIAQYARLGLARASMDSYSALESQYFATQKQQQHTLVDPDHCPTSMRISRPVVFRDVNTLCLPDRRERERTNSQMAILFFLVETAGYECGVVVWLGVPGMPEPVCPWHHKGYRPGFSFVALASQ